MTTADRYTGLANLIASSNRVKFGGGVPEAFIADAERHLKITFPPSYRWWLATYGVGFIRGYELQGLFPELITEREPNFALTGDVVYLAGLQAKRPDHPRHLVQILSYEGDEVYFLDTARRGADGECPVVRRFAVGDDLLDVAPDFATFLEFELTR